VLHWTTATRRALVAMLAVALCVAAGLASARPARGYAAGSGASPPQTPPRISLVSKAGAQRGVEGSYCVAVVTDEGGVVRCADGVDPEPRRLSVVRPRERVTIRLRGATEADGAVSVHPRGCEDLTRWRFKITGPITHWIVPRILRPKRRFFELSLFAEFTMADGRTGDTSGALGLLISRTRPRDVIPAHDHLACGQPAP
jgi:hypothetical protein